MMTRRKPHNQLCKFLTPHGARALVAALALGALFVSAPMTPRRALFVWNASASAPIGLYRVVHDRAVARGNLVLVIPTPSVAAFAAARGYLPKGIPLVKRIAAVADDTICTRANRIFINAHFAAIRLTKDRQGRALPAWSGCRRLTHNEIFLLMAHVRDSFDSRYFGPVAVSQLAGRLKPLWTR